MEIQDFWNIYTGGLAPADLVWQFGKGDAKAGVQSFVQQRPSMYGILCRDSWKNTFASEKQYNREQIGAALLTYLELNRESWENQVEELAKTDAEAKLAERKRVEAEALAVAVARVEAEARGGALPEEPQQQEQAAPDIQPTPTPPSPMPPESPPSQGDGLSQARTSSDAEAIAAAMARVEAEARAKAAAEDQAQEQTTGTTPESPQKDAIPLDSDNPSNP